MNILDMEKCLKSDKKARYKWERKESAAEDKLQKRKSSRTISQCKTSEPQDGIPRPRKRNPALIYN